MSQLIFKKRRFFRSQILETLELYQFMNLLMNKMTILITLQIFKQKRIDANSLTKLTEITKNNAQLSRIKFNQIIGSVISNNQISFKNCQTQIHKKFRCWMRQTPR